MEWIPVTAAENLHREYDYEVKHVISGVPEVDAMWIVKLSANYLYAMTPNGCVNRCPNGSKGQHMFYCEKVFLNAEAV